MVCEETGKQTNGLSKGCPIGHHGDCGEKLIQQFKDEF